MDEVIFINLGRQLRWSKQWTENPWIQVRYLVFPLRLWCKLVNTSDCGSEECGFNSHLSPLGDCSSVGQNACLINKKSVVQVYPIPFTPHGQVWLKLAVSKTAVTRSNRVGVSKLRIAKSRVLSDKSLTSSSLT